MKFVISMIALFLTETYLDALNLSTMKEITQDIYETKLVDMHIITDADIMVIAGENSVYIPDSESKGWQRIFFIDGDEKIVDITGFDRKIFIGTKHKVFAGDIKRKNFIEIFSISRENEIRALELSTQQYLYAGTQKGLWRISLNGNGEKKFFPEIHNIISLRAHPFEPDIIFVGTLEGLFKVTKREIKLLYTSISRTYARVNSISISKSNDDIIFIATDAGLLRMRLKDKEFRDLKLNSRILYVDSLDTKPETIVAIGEKDLFYSEDGIEKWIAIPGLIPHGIPIKFIQSSDGSIFLLTDSGIFQSGDDKLNSNSLKMIEQIFASEPAIEEMERALLRAYMLDNNIIKRWKKNSRLKALLPEIDISMTAGLDRDYDFDVKDTIYTSSTTGRYFIGPDERKLSESRGKDLSYGIKLSWNLPEAIFNSEELSVSNEVEDILDLKYRALSELRRVYFERRRLIAEYYLSAEDGGYKRFELKNRIDELTAYLDMLSDGYFSKAIKGKN